MKQQSGRRDSVKAPDWFVSTWAVLAIATVYGLRDGFFAHNEAMTALWLAGGWAAVRGAFALLANKAHS